MERQILSRRQFSEAVFREYMSINSMLMMDPLPQDKLKELLDRQLKLIKELKRK